VYIEKRWLLPAALSLLLLGACFAVVLLLLGSRVPEASGAVRAAEITSSDKPSTAPEPGAQETASTETPAAEVAPPAGVAPAPQIAPATQVIPAAEVVPAAKIAPPPNPDPVVAEVAPTVQPPEEAIEIDTRASDNTQINTRGFGDIGMQFQDVNINAPIINIHISSQGNNNATNVNIGDANTIVSEQERLQSNRSDGSAPQDPTSTQGSAGTQTDTPPPAEVVPVT
jgi:outer membrane biosynthesis protein TonB